MRFLPVFLDLEAGPIFLVGAGELALAKLRLLLAAGARVRWHAIDGNYAVSSLDPTLAATISRYEADPLTADLKSVIAVLCAGAGATGRQACLGRIDRAMTFDRLKTCV